MHLCSSLEIAVPIVICMDFYNCLKLIVLNSLFKHFKGRTADLIFILGGTPEGRVLPNLNLCTCI